MYKRNANQLSSDLMSAFPNAKVLINETKPRSKSFELSVVKEDGEGKIMYLSKAPSTEVFCLMHMDHFLFPQRHG